LEKTCGGKERREDKEAVRSRAWLARGKGKEGENPDTGLDQQEQPRGMGGRATKRLVCVTPVRLRKKKKKKKNAALTAGRKGRKKGENEVQGSFDLYRKKKRQTIIEDQY